MTLKKHIIIFFVLTCFGCKAIRYKYLDEKQDNCITPHEVVDLSGIFQYTYKKVPNSYLYWYKDARFLDANTGSELQLYAMGGQYVGVNKVRVNEIEKERNIKAKGVGYDRLFCDFPMGRKITEEESPNYSIHAGGELYDNIADSTLLTVAFYMEITAFLVKDDCEEVMDVYNKFMTLPICPVPANRMELPHLLLIHYNHARELTTAEIDSLGLKRSKVKYFEHRDCSG